MGRGIAVLVSTLVAVSAKAQEAQRSSGDGQSRAAPGAEAKADRLRMILASTTPMETQSTPLLPSNGPAPQPHSDERGVTRPAATPATTDCSVVEALLGDAALAIRKYGAPPAEHDNSPWKTAPWVWRASRCGNRYFIQVKSRSSEPWVLQQARLEGPNGVVLKVDGVRSRSRRDGWDVNIIVAEVPEDAKAEFPLLRVHLAGEDGRVAVLDKVVLP